MLSKLHSYQIQVDTKDELISSSFDLVLSSPSKVNLFFKVIAKRVDGFHEIASLYQAIGLYDTLYFKRSDALRVTCSDNTLLCDDSNLVTKALRLFQSKTGIDPSVQIHLVKNIPIQAGLGGGSSNAATTLFGLNELYGRPASSKELEVWSSELGSDVPFFFSSGSAYCTGRGEKLHNVVPLSLPSHLTVVKPKEGLSTPLVYKNCRVDEFQVRDPEKSLQSFIQGEPEYYNDLEIPSFAILPSLKEMKTMLASLGFSHVVMCGSGTAFFCIGEGTIPKDCPWQVQNVPFIQRKDNAWYE